MLANGQYESVGAASAALDRARETLRTTLTNATNTLPISALGTLTIYDNATGGVQTLPDAATAWATMPFGIIVLHIKNTGIPTFAAAGSDSLRLSAAGARYGMISAQIISATEWAQFASGF